MILAATGALVFLLGRVQSQTITAASCNASTGFSWSYNSLDQDPCTVATYLGGVCNNGQYTIPAINSTQYYSGPPSSAQNECRCSTVFYSLLMACGECQAATTITWSSYSQNCSTVYTGIFLDSIPSGTKVPHWAYQDVVTSDHFNSTLAQLTGDSPETISGAQSTSASTPSSPVTASNPSSTSSSAAQGDTSKSSKSHTGAIVGGVVGGVVGLALIIAAIYWVLRKHSHDRNTRARPQPISGHDHDMSPGLTGTTNAPSMSAYPPVQQKLYSPDDPSTFPPNVISPSTPTMTHAPYSSVIDVGSVYNQPSTFSHNINISPAGPRKTYPGYAEV